MHSSATFAGAHSTGCCISGDLVGHVQFFHIGHCGKNMTPQPIMTFHNL